MHIYEKGKYINNLVVLCISIEKRDRPQKYFLELDCVNLRTNLSNLIGLGFEKTYFSSFSWICTFCLIYIK